MKYLKVAVVLGLALIVFANLAPVIGISLAKLGAIGPAPGMPAGTTDAISWLQLLVWAVAVLCYAAAAVQVVRNGASALLFWATGLALDLGNYFSIMFLGDYQKVRGSTDQSVDLIIYGLVIALGFGIHALARKHRAVALA